MINVKAFAAVAAVGLSLAGCVETTGGYVGDGMNRVVTISNQSGRTVYRFYGSNAGTIYWEEDLLGSNVLPSGRSMNVDFTDGSGYCEFDFKIEFADGTYYEDYGINVCSVATYTIR